MYTLNFNSSRFETSFFNAEKTFIVCYDDRDNRNAGLNCEMECSLFEWKEHGTISIGTSSFWKNPHALLEQSALLRKSCTLFCFICFTALSKVLSAEDRLARSMNTVPLNTTTKLVRDY